MPPTHPISPLGRLRVALTVDDLLLFRNVRSGPGRTSQGNARAFTQALRAHGVKGVYQFSNSAPAQDDPELFAVFDHWVENGHHVGNHTHHHPSLNWLDADTYARDIELAETYLGRYIRAAPRRCFRFCMDMWGDTQCKCDEILKRLGEMDYTPVPVTAGFHDFRWHAAHTRVSTRGSSDDLALLQNRYVQAAVRGLRVHAANARAVFGRDPVHIWLIHGTPLAAECLDQILSAFTEAGVDFVSLDEALADPVNAQVPPRVSPEFIFQIEKWALAKGVPVNDLHPKVLHEIEQIHSAPGESADDVARVMRQTIADATGARVRPLELSPDQQLQ